MNVNVNLDHRYTHHQPDMNFRYGIFVCLARFVARPFLFYFFSLTCYHPRCAPCSVLGTLTAQYCEGGLATMSVSLAEGRAVVEETQRSVCV